MVTDRETPSITTLRPLFVPSITVDAARATAAACTAPPLDWVTAIEYRPLGGLAAMSEMPRRVAVEDTASDAAVVTTAVLAPTVFAERMPLADARRSMENVSEPAPAVDDNVADAALEETLE